MTTAGARRSRADAPLLFDDVPGNVALDFHYGDSEKVTAAFAAAAHVTRLKLVNNRAGRQRDRAARGDRRLRPGERALHAACALSQGVFGMKGNMAGRSSRSTPDKVRVLTGNVGGSFGMKRAVYPEYVCILHAARALGRPVKWTDERSGSFVSDNHGRDHELTAELALDADGNFLALRLDGFGNLGGFLGAVAPHAVDAQRREATSSASTARR